MKEKRMKLLKALDELNGGNDWEEIEFEYYCFWSNNNTNERPPGYINTKEQALLKKFGFDLESPFIFCVHYTSYSSVGHETYSVAHIVRAAIKDPEYNMEQFREKYTEDRGGYSYGTSSIVTINPR